MAKVRLVKAMFRHLTKNVMMVKVTIRTVKKTHCSNTLSSVRVLSALTTDFSTMAKDTINSFNSFLGRCLRDPYVAVQNTDSSAYAATPSLFTHIPRQYNCPQTGN